jgi:hypothetical protein
MSDLTPKQRRELAAQLVALRERLEDNKALLRCLVRQAEAKEKLRALRGADTG